jgi:hypothetical protein
MKHVLQVSSFPSCCGARIISGFFANTPNEIKETLTHLDELLKGATPVSVVILASFESGYFHQPLLDRGFKIISENQFNYSSTLTTYVYECPANDKRWASHKKAQEEARLRLEEQQKRFAEAQVKAMKARTVGTSTAAAAVFLSAGRW